MQMDAIEPHWTSLLWFAALATVCTLAFLVVAGMFPLRSRPQAAKSIAGLVLVTGNVALLVVLSIGTGLFGYSELRWSTLVVVAGLVVLFAPGLFEVWPSSFRDGAKGLLVLIGIQLLALVTLAKIAVPGWANIS
jgi:hypothetical protein